MRMYGIFYQNKMIDGTLRSKRKMARKDFAREAGTKWGHLWELGYRVGEVKWRGCNA